MAGFKVYKNGEYRFEDKTVNGKIYNNVLTNENGEIISGYDHFIGNAEKRRNKEIIHVDLSFTSGNYALFYEGNNETLKNALYAVVELQNNSNTLSEKKKSILFSVLINSLHIVHHVNTKGRKSKLNGINSISTCCLDNCYCLDRIKNNDSVCAHCYSATQQKQQLALQDRNTINGIILKNIVIPAKYWKKYINPLDMSKYFRIESFGDVANKTQAINYIEFIKAFPRVHFAIWSKNVGIWHFAFADAGKPDNVSFVVSSNKLNKPELHYMKTYDFINHVFTVYDKQFISDNNITINCGGRSCMECIKRHKACYFTDTEKEISEQLK